MEEFSIIRQERKIKAMKIIYEMVEMVCALSSLVKGLQTSHQA